MLILFLCTKLYVRELTYFHQKSVGVGFDFLLDSIHGISWLECEPLSTTMPAYIGIFMDSGDAAEESMAAEITTPDSHWWSFGI